MAVTEDGSLATSGAPAGRAATELAERGRRPLQRVQHLLHAHPAASPATSWHDRVRRPGVV